MLYDDFFCTKLWFSFELGYMLPLCSCKVCLETGLDLTVGGNLPADSADLGWLNMACNYLKLKLISDSQIMLIKNGKYNIAISKRECNRRSKCQVSLWSQSTPQLTLTTGSI